MEEEEEEEEEEEDPGMQEAAAPPKVKKVQIMQNETETKFHRVYKVSPTQQLTKLRHLLRESGDSVSLFLSSLWSTAADVAADLRHAAGQFPSTVM